VTKQAASQLVDEIVRKGYAERRPHPDDARARLVVLTERGWACTRAAEEAAADAVRTWVGVLGESEVQALLRQLVRIAPRGPIRPTW
jgi:DNA-binding MarR family transcriptional regulator